MSHNSFLSSNQGISVSWFRKLKAEAIVQHPKSYGTPGNQKQRYKVFYKKKKRNRIESNGVLAKSKEKSLL